MTTPNASQQPGQKPNKKRQLSTSWSLVVMLLWTPIARKLQKSPQSNLYRTCRECPMDVFIDCLVDGKYERLTKSGKATPEESLSAWQTLFVEYCDLSEDQEIKSLIKLSAGIRAMECRITTIQMCVYILSVKNSENCIEQLKALGFKRKFAPETLVSDLKSALSIVKSLEIELNQQRGVLQKIISKNEGAKVGRDYFDGFFIDISKYMGFRLTQESTTVHEFTVLRRKMIKEIKRQSVYKNGIKKPGKGKNG